MFSIWKQTLNICYREKITGVLKIAYIYCYSRQF